MSSVEATTGKGNPIDRAAAHWVARAMRGLDAEERAELAAWRAADPRHAGSYVRALAIARMAAAPISQPLVCEPADADSISVSARLSRRRAFQWAAAACIAGMIGAGGFYQVLGNRTSTARGEIRNIALADGSTAVLNTSSSIAVSMRAKRRAVDLLEGEAWFDVAHDPARPFEVRSGELVVRAVGTAFTVRSRPEGTDVVVTEGTVAIFREGKGGAPIRLTAGKQLNFARGTMVEASLTGSQLEQQLAWRQGLIILDGQTLDVAVAEFNRYNDLKLEIMGGKLASQRVYGTFRVRDPEGLAKAVTIALGARMTRSNSKLILQ